MDFFQDVRDIIEHVAFHSYYNGECPFCRCRNFTIIDTRSRTLPDLGGPTRRLSVDLEVKTIQCVECGMTFTPEHPYYPPFLHYTLDVVQFALSLAHRRELSAQVISALLWEEHHVEVDPKTVQSWVNTYSEQYFQTYFAKKPQTAVEDFRAITIDGTHFRAGKDLIGKKKVAEFSSVTRLAGNAYLLTWWE